MIIGLCIFTTLSCFYRETRWRRETNLGCVSLIKINTYLFFELKVMNYEKIICLIKRKIST